jgi:hypothetical protein
LIHNPESAGHPPHEHNVEDSIKSFIASAGCR